MDIAIVAKTYERAKRIQQELGLPRAILISARSPGSIDGLVVDRWLIDDDPKISPAIVKAARWSAGKKFGAIVRMVRVTPPD